ncbi:membrane protein DedA with SNARE-associated domain [Stella humosa]|uniref:Membrane protein DedA with SNARE-associated domain n=1 Tax=Stella humosa TaxID=94 RepID=A0A3N1M0J0_9PROT|nr:DedA family protein [Stella humosa]ROQ01004.1 membrane protein DedA with SNARE-associated domain [Stella humosa]BBK31372.1 DedA family protein [Stella humosa]
MSVEQLIADYGTWFYVITFFWTFLEGETFVIIAGVAAQKGLLDWWSLFLCAWFGSFCGDQTYFWIGRLYGPKVLAKFPRWRAGVEGALSQVQRNSTWFILTFRFIYGVRNFASFSLGMARVQPMRFAVLNFIAAFVWALSFAGAGYIFGEAFEAVAGEWVQGVGLVLLTCLALFAILMIMRARRNGKRRRAAEAHAAASPVEPPAGT